MTTFDKSLKTETLSAISQAVMELKNGNTVAIPTETVYGLAAKISDESAIRKIFEIKNRPFFDPLIVHVASIDQAKSLVSQWPIAAQILAEKFWPGPLTMVLPKNERVSSLITSGLETVALRQPRHPMALNVIEQLGEPIAAPSANKFGRTSPSMANHVIAEFENSILVLDGGPCEIGIESTILKITEISGLLELTILRDGAITPTLISQALQPLNKSIVFNKPQQIIEAPGQIKHHYMPSIPLLFIQRENWTAIHESLESLNRKLNTEFQTFTELSLSTSPAQAARELYGQLRLCSAPPSELIIFIKEDFHIGEDWAGLIDRLNRASSFHLLEKFG